MTEGRMTHPDPLIDEVRARRRALLAEQGGDLGTLYAAIRRLQSTHPEKIGRLRRTSAQPGSR